MGHWDYGDFFCAECLLDDDYYSGIGAAGIWSVPIRKSGGYFASVRQLRFLDKYDGSFGQFIFISFDRHFYRLVYNDKDSKK